MLAGSLTSCFYLTAYLFGLPEKQSKKNGKAPQRTKINTPFELISGAIRLDGVLKDPSVCRLRSFLKFPRDPSGCIAIVPFFTFVVRKAQWMVG